MQEPTKWPTKIKQGNVVITVYKTAQKKGDAQYTSYRVVSFSPADNKRVWKTFSKWDKAHEYASTVGATINKGDADVLTLTSADRLVYLRAVEALKPLPDIPLDVAVHDYAVSRRLLGQHSMKEAAEFFVANCKEIQSRTVQQVVDEFVEKKTKRTKWGTPASAKYEQDFGKLQAFAKDFQVPVTTITGPMIDAWLDKKDIAPRTRENYINIIRTLLKFAQFNKYFPKNQNPWAELETDYEDLGAVEIFTPEELRRLLNAARPEMVPFLAIGAFAGLRHYEIRRLDWAQVGSKSIEVIPQQRTRTRRHRFAPIRRTLAKWLAPHRKKSGPVMPFEHVSKQIGWLCNKAAVEWKHNALRHSYISYRLAECHDENLVASECGNSPVMIQKHYRKALQPRDAKQWFGVLPGKAVANVIPMQAAAPG